MQSVWGDYKMDGVKKSNVKIKRKSTIKKENKKNNIIVPQFSLEQKTKKQYKSKIRSINSTNSLGVTIPHELTIKLGLNKGDTIKFITNEENGKLDLEINLELKEGE